MRPKESVRERECWRMESDSVIRLLIRVKLPEGAITHKFCHKIYQNRRGSMRRGRNMTKLILSFIMQERVRQ